MSNYCELTITTNNSSANGTYRVGCSYVPYITTDGSNISSNSITLYKTDGTRITINSLDNTARYYSTSGYNYSDVTISKVQYNSTASFYYWLPSLPFIILFAIFLRRLIKR